MAEVVTATKTVVIGLGNPYLGDDGVGVQVIRALADRLRGRDSVTVTELPAGGLRLMEAMVGCQRAFVVDAVRTGRKPPGTVMWLLLEDLELSLHCACSHDTSLGWALESGRRLGLDLPAEISVLGIEAARFDTFGEPMSPEVAGAVAEAERALLREIGRGANSDR
ncbi:MAG: hydrogenase maturation protease [Deltaproteobacteria bacterium]